MTFKICVMLAQNTHISYHTEANGCIFFAVGVKDPSTQAFEFQTESLYFVTLDAKSSRKPTGISALNIKDKKICLDFLGMQQLDRYSLVICIYGLCTYLSQCFRKEIHKIPF